MSKHNLLLVDGDTRSLRVLEVSLRKAGFAVTAASSPVEVIEALQLRPPDLIICETKFEVGNGFELRQQLQATDGWSQIPFVFLTSETAIEFKIKGLELGVDDYLTKPIYIKEIVARIGILLQKKQRARIEERQDNRTRFVGRIADMPVVDVIQTIEVSRKSGVIQFVGDRNQQAAIYFRDGRVIDAEAGTLIGEEAVYRLLTWTDGDFEVLFRTVRRREAITLTSQALLLEGMRRVDEWTRLLEQLPAVHARFDIDIAELASQLSEIPDEHNAILRLIDGRRTMLEIIDTCPMGDLESLQTIARMFFEGLLVDVSGKDIEPSIVGRLPAKPLDNFDPDRWASEQSPVPTSGRVVLVADVEQLREAAYAAELTGPITPLPVEATLPTAVGKDRLQPFDEYGPGALEEPLALEAPRQVEARPVTVDASMMIEAEYPPPPVRSITQDATGMVIEEVAFPAPVSDVPAAAAEDSAGPVYAAAAAEGAPVAGAEGAAVTGAEGAAAVTGAEGAATVTGVEGELEDRTIEAPPTLVEEALHSSVPELDDLLAPSARAVKPLPRPSGLRLVDEAVAAAQAIVAEGERWWPNQSKANPAPAAAEAPVAESEISSDTSAAITSAALHRADISVGDSGEFVEVRASSQDDTQARVLSSAPSGEAVASQTVEEGQIDTDEQRGQIAVRIISSAGQETATTAGEMESRPRTMSRSPARQMVTIRPRKATQRDPSGVGAAAEADHLAEPVSVPPRPVSSPQLADLSEELEGEITPPQRRGFWGLALLFAVAVLGVAVYLKYQLDYRPARSTSSKNSGAASKSHVGAPIGHVDAATHTVVPVDAAVPAGSIDAPPVVADAPKPIDAPRPTPPVRLPDTAKPVKPAPQPTEPRKYRDLMRRAEAAIAGGDPVLALGLASESILDKPTARAYIIKADAFRRMSKVNEALTAIDRAIEIARDYAPAWEMKGRILWGAGRATEARAAFERYLQLEPNGAQAETIRTMIGK